MITVKVDMSGLDKVLSFFKKEDQVIDERLTKTAEYARKIILERVNAGQLSDGGYRVTRSIRRDGRYSQKWAKERRQKGLPTSVHTLNYTGGLYANFKVSAVKKQVKTRHIQLYFTSKRARREDGSASDLTYAGLARVQEERTGLGFYLSTQQAKEVIRYYKSLK